jgi:hypothetical protein
MASRFAETWVVLIDILGFSKRVSDLKRRDALVEAYSEIVEKVLPNTSNLIAAKYVRPGSSTPGILETDPPVPWPIHQAHVEEVWRRKVRVFSDSIFLFFDEVYSTSGPAAPFMLPSAVREIARALWERRIPHRGAIAYGDCLVDADRNIFLGRAIVDAHEWERSQQWMAVSVAPGSLLAARGNLGGGISRAGFVHNVSAPTAEGDVVTWVVNPFESPLAVDGFLLCYSEAVESGEPASVLVKYTHTARFLRDQGVGSDLAKRLEQIAGLT